MPKRIPSRRVRRMRRQRRMRKWCLMRKPFRASIRERLPLSKFNRSTRRNRNSLWIWAAACSSNWSMFLPANSKWARTTPTLTRTKSRFTPVRITKPFSIGKTPVTVAQFKRFAAATGFETDAERQGKGFVLADKTWRYVEGATWRTPGFDQDDSHPVVMVSWNDAQAFAKWASSVSGRRVSLPTEAQWEYAARGPQSLKYPWGNAWSGTKANHADLSFKNSGFRRCELAVFERARRLRFYFPGGALQERELVRRAGHVGQRAAMVPGRVRREILRGRKNGRPGQRRTGADARAARRIVEHASTQLPRRVSRQRLAVIERYPYYGFRVAVEHCQNRRHVLWRACTRSGRGRNPALFVRISTRATSSTRSKK